MEGVDHSTPARNHLPVLLGHLSASFDQFSARIQGLELSSDNCLWHVSWCGAASSSHSLVEVKVVAKKLKSNVEKGIPGDESDLIDLKKAFGSIKHIFLETKGGVSGGLSGSFSRYDTHHLDGCCSSFLSTRHKD